ncbi:helix-turn-helix domain-containing protein [Ligilactobacillus cholophilus]|uniref:helix-turn-helix domain-containing protein n=1 Tax=Ligilactobacillus cholophilus TaxID=3050131 RepID=UPI0025B052DA|nr:helix-turn-helix domain-containing protein [Ligilactobacillus cholophilus]
MIEEKELIEEIREACNHNEWLIIKQYLAGKNVTEIARQLNVSRTTIYQHRKRLRNKLLRIFENKS